MMNLCNLVSLCKIEGSEIRENSCLCRDLNFYSSPSQANQAEWFDITINSAIIL